LPKRTVADRLALVELCLKVQLFCLARALALLTLRQRCSGNRKATSASARSLEGAHRV
jgi:hypothetical protein